MPCYNNPSTKNPILFEVDARPIYTSSSGRAKSVVPQVPNGQDEQSRRGGQTIMSSEGILSFVSSFLLKAFEAKYAVSVTK